MNLLPEDIIYQIIINVNIKDLISFIEISVDVNKIYQKNMKSILYGNLSRITKYRINKYDINALKKLYHISINKSYFTDSDSPILLLTETGKVYSFGNDMCGLPEIGKVLYINH